MNIDTKLEACKARADEQKRLAMQKTFDTVREVQTQGALLRVIPFYGRTHAPIVNQYKIHVGNSRVFYQSYGALVACVVDGVVILDGKYYNYSRTTSKYLWQFLREFVGDGAQTPAQGVKNGVYRVASLNGAS